MMLEEWMDNIDQHRCGDYKIDLYIGNEIIWSGKYTEYDGWINYKDYEVCRVWFGRKKYIDREKTMNGCTIYYEDCIPLIAIEIEYV